MIGEGTVFEGPFGPRRVTYADYAASGRSLVFIEDYIRAEILPWYANSHTEASFTGLQTSRFRAEARHIISEAAHAGDDYATVFCGAGATGAIHKLIEILNLRIPADLDRRHGLSATIPPEMRPVVFIGPYEHHSNEVSWRETIADVVVIGEDEKGQIDVPQLRRALCDYRHRPLKLGSFSAASNVTGIITNRHEVSAALHEGGANSLWDYAAGGPYLNVDVRGDGPGTHLDAVFLSPHKFVGGPGTPGVLIVTKDLLRNRVPSVPGGGTVSYVSPTRHHFIDEPAEREEGGTPAIVESVRAGVVFALKEAVGRDTIRLREEAIVERALAYLGDNTNIEILGNTEAPRLAILSFNVRHGTRYLHHNLVVALLNDLFGIQVRGGCLCAGPYGHRLLGIGETLSLRFEDAIVRGYEGLKPGWVRLSFNYFFPDRQVEFLLRAVDWIARQGWRLLPAYAFDVSTGLWRHREWNSPLRSLPRGFNPAAWDAERATPAPHDLTDVEIESYFEQADAAADRLHTTPKNVGDGHSLPGGEDLHWFATGVN